MSSFQESEVDRHAIPVGETVVASRHVVPAKGDEIEDLPEGNRHHGEVDAAQMNDQAPDDRRGDGGGGDADQHAEKRVGDEVFDRKARAIGPEAEIGGVAERKDAGVAKQEVERGGGERHDEHECAQLGVAADRIEPVGRSQQHEPDEGVRGQPPAPAGDHCSRPSSPKRPRGRTSRTSAIST